MSEIRLNRILKVLFLIFVYMAVFTLILFNLPKFSYAEDKDNKPEVNVNIQLNYKDKPVVNTDVQFNGDTEPKININIDKEDKDNKNKKKKNTNVWLDNISNGFIQYISKYISRQNNSVLAGKNYTINIKDKKVGDTGESNKNPVKQVKSNSKQINPVEDHDSIIIKIDYLLEKILKVKKEKITSSIGININNIEDLLDTEKIIEKHHILAVIDLDEIIDLNYTSDIKTVRETGQTEKLPGFVLNIWNKFKQLIILYG